MKKARIYIKSFWCLLLALCTVTFGCIVYVDKTLPENFQVCEGDSLSVSCQIPVNINSNSVNGSVPAQAGLTAGNKYTVDLKIFGFIPVKTSTVSVIKQNSVVVLGNPFGIKIYSEGVMVVGTTDVDTKAGLKNPALISGIKKGDIIISIDGLNVSSNEDIAKIIEESGGKSLKFSVTRNGKNMQFKVKPLKSKTENKYKIGIWVRDSSAGIGTFTFYSPKNKIVAGLGHAICDNDTGKIIPLNYGELVDADILTVSKGKSGTAGELKGIFKNTTFGEFLYNSQVGVFGKVTENVTFNGEYVQVANKQEVKTGKAEILSTIEGNTPQRFECEIEKVHFNDESNTKNMIIRITDKKLLKETGGIVQGMSGSPILQNGKLIGAVTHVFLNDATKGYGIFAENMLDQIKNIK